MKNEQSEIECLNTSFFFQQTVFSYWAIYNLILRFAQKMYLPATLSTQLSRFIFIMILYINRLVFPLLANQLHYLSLFQLCRRENIRDIKSYEYCLDSTVFRTLWQNSSFLSLTWLVFDVIVRLKIKLMRALLSRVLNRNCDSTDTRKTYP